MAIGTEGDCPDSRNTLFAPAGRDAPELIECKRAVIRRNPTHRALLDAMPSWVFLLNGQRQVVSANAALLRLVGCTEDEIVGKRPGEIIGCVHAAAGPDGCGTAASCADCGAVRAVLECQRTGEVTVSDCRLRTGAVEGGGALELQVTATPIELEGEPFILAALEDVGARSRLTVLNRVFFHDVMNTVVGLKAHFRLLATKAERGAVAAEEIGELERYVDQLGDDIRAQRELMLAEAGDLKVKWATRSTGALLESLRSMHAVTAELGVHIEIADCWEGSIETDEHLLIRVVGNMLQNAIEATAVGETVTLSCHEEDDTVRFSVHNHGTMPDEVQRQVFHRSFSTKAATGRGIGTHSMKLIGERYLLGAVDFTSTEEGTTFWVTLPKRRPVDV